MTEIPKPRLFERLRLPANVIDTTERSVGTITAVVGYVGPKGPSGTSEPRPQPRRGSTRLTCRRSPVWRKRTNIVVARYRAMT
jgi:hypothetical protein